MTSQEYEVQHFGFSSEQLSLERRYAIKDVLGDLLEPVVKKLSVSEQSALHLNQQKSKVIEKMLQTFEDSLKAIEKLDVENFSIPEHVLLTKDSEHVGKYTMDDEKVLDGEIDYLKRLYLENSIMMASLEVENNQCEMVDSVAQNEVALQNQIQESLKLYDMKKTLKMVELNIKMSKV